MNFEKPHLTPLHDIYASLVYSVNKADVAYVILGGRVHLEDGRLTLIDQEKAVAQARAIGQKFR